MRQLWFAGIFAVLVCLAACGESSNGSGSDGDTDTDSDVDGEGEGDVDVPADGELPTGIPMPEFGYLYDTSAGATIYVDNTNPDCDDTGEGTAEIPFCDLFRGSYEMTYDPGDVVHILGGPYDYSGDQRLVLNGTVDNPVIILGVETPLFNGAGSLINLEYDGSYGIVEGIEFFDHTRHRVLETAHHLVFRDIEIHNPTDAIIDYNPVFNVNGTQILIYESRIHHNWRDGDSDAHGIQAGEGSSWVWVLYNELYANSGDSFQGCHQCFDAPPHHVFIGGNLMHDDRENGVDLKTIHDVVVSENRMYGYVDSSTSAGDAMVVGSNGYDASTNMGPRNVWIINNEFFDSARGIRVEGVEDVWVIGNLFHDLERAIQIDDKEYRDITIAANTIWNTGDGIINWNESCSARSVVLTNNLLSSMSDGRHLDLPACNTHTLDSNLLWQSGDAFDARVEGDNCTTAEELNATDVAAGTVDGDPSLNDEGRPTPGSAAIDAGAPLESLFSLFETLFDAEIRSDFSHGPRPAGETPDIGAWEQ